MDVVLTLAVSLALAFILIILLAAGVYQKNTNKICLSRKRLEGKTVIVTGGTTGMGLVIATDLAHRGARVIIACPFEEEGINARNQIIEETENEKVIFKLLDLGSIDSTRKFAEDILESETRLDILINNAGVGIPQEFITKDGMNFVMQVNYYGTFLLTLLLLPLLKKTGKPGEPSRILTTTSVLHRIARVDLEKANKTNYWYKLQLYGNSKIFLIHFTNELSKRLEGSNVVINTVDPGAVGTAIFNSINVVVGTVITIFFCIMFKSPWYGAQTALHAALDKEAGKVSGAYFKNCEIGKAVRRAYCDKTSKMLWEESVRLVKLTDEELMQCFQ